MGFFKPDYHPCPTEDLLTWAFDHCTYDKDKPVLYSLEDPSRSLSWRQARSTIRKLIAGFRKAGLKKGQCVSVTAFNDVRKILAFKVRG
jgi:4-coumarate--CoA ligase